MKKFQLYTLKDDVLMDWMEVTKCQLETEMLPPVFCKVSLTVMEVLEVTLRQAPTTQVLEVDVNGNVIAQEVECSPGFTTVRDFFCHGEVCSFEERGSVHCTSMQKDLSPSAVGIGPINRKSWLCHCLELRRFC